MRVFPARELQINSIIIPKLGAAGAAIGTVTAEITVLIVQVVALKKFVLPILCKLSYGKNILALFGGTIASIWVLLMNMGSFVTLAVSAILFFGVYSAVLLLLKESLAWEIFNQMLKILKRNRG